MVRDPDTAREMRRQDLFAKLGPGTQAHDPDWHWWLQMRDLELAAETAAGVRASFEAIEHRRAVQEYWLEDWKHRGLTLDAASELVGAGKKNATWAKEWFKGYSAPYLDRTPPTSVKWPARAWGWLSRRKTRRADRREEVRRAERRAARGGDAAVPGGRCLRAAAGGGARGAGRERVGGRGRAGAPGGVPRSEARTPRRRRAKPPSTRATGTPLGGRLTAAQQERERARREAERREALAASAPAGANQSGSGENGGDDPDPSGAATGASVDASASEKTNEPVRDDVDALFRAFKNFRDNVDLMAMRDGAVDDAFVFEILLEDMERRAEAVGAKDVCLAPLHATALDFVVGQLSAYRDALTDDARSVRLMEGDSVYARCHDLPSRAERRRAALRGRARRVRRQVTRALEGACEEMEKGALRRLDAPPHGGGDDVAVGASDAPFSSSSWRDHLRGLHSKVDALGVRGGGGRGDARGGGTRSRARRAARADGR